MHLLSRIGESVGHLFAALLVLVLDLKLELDVVEHVRDSWDRERRVRPDEIYRGSKTVKRVSDGAL